MCTHIHIYVHIYVCTSLLASSSRVGIDYYLRSPVNYPAKQPAAHQLRKTISIISLTYRRRRRLPTACTPRCIPILHTLFLSPSLSLSTVDRLYKKITIINSDYYSSRRKKNRQRDWISSRSSQDGEFLTLVDPWKFIWKNGSEGSGLGWSRSEAMISDGCRDD